jgi:peptide deformylase
MIKEVCFYGNPVLRLKAKEVRKFDASLQALAEDLFETMEDVGGIGLAAPQIGVSLQVFVIDLKEGPKTKLAVVNPVLTLSGRTEPFREGCLSIPGISGEVLRPADAHLEALTLEGKKFVMDASGLLARAMQHETDHLNGIFFVDRLTPVRRALITGKLKKLEKDFAAGRRPANLKEEADSLL